MATVLSVMFLALMVLGFILIAFGIVALLAGVFGSGTKSSFEENVRIIGAVVFMVAGGVFIVIGGTFLRMVG